MSAGRVLVTGASGFTGRHACRLLAARGWEVAAACSPHADPGELAELGAVFAEGCDLTDGANVRKLIRSCRPDAMLHLAGRNAVDVSWRSPETTLSANLMTTVHLLEAARESGSCRLLVAGSMLRTPLDRLGDAPHPYGFSKTLQLAAALAWQRWYGLPVIVVEPSNLIGPGGSAGLCGKIARWAAETEAGLGGEAAFALSSLQERRDFLDVRDAVAAYELLLREGVPGTLYALESGRFRSLGEVKDAFDEVAQVPLNWRIGDSQAVSPRPRDAQPIRRLGWKPAVPFRQSIRDALEEERRRLQGRRDAQ